MPVPEREKAGDEDPSGAEVGGPGWKPLPSGYLSKLSLNLMNSGKAVCLEALLGKDGSLLSANKQSFPLAFKDELGGTAGEERRSAAGRPLEEGCFALLPCFRG